VKTTLELPDDLMRRVKLRAVHRGRKLKDEIAQLLEAGMARADEPDAPRKPPRPVRLLDRRKITAREIDDAIATGRD